LAAAAALQRRSQRQCGCGRVAAVIHVAEAAVAHETIEY